jgi:hypothetical protein
MKERPPVLEYQRVWPQGEEPASRSGEWVVLIAFVVIAIIMFLVSA